MRPVQSKRYHLVWLRSRKVSAKGHPPRRMWEVHCDIGPAHFPHENCMLGLAPEIPGQLISHQNFFLTVISTGTETCIF